MACKVVFTIVKGRNQWITCLQSEKKSLKPEPSGAQIKLKALLSIFSNRMTGLPCSYILFLLKYMLNILLNSLELLILRSNDKSEYFAVSQVSS